MSSCFSNLFIGFGSEEVQHSGETYRLAIHRRPNPTCRTGSAPPEETFGAAKDWNPPLRHAFAVPKDERIVFYRSDHLKTSDAAGSSKSNTNRGYLMLKPLTPDSESLPSRTSTGADIQYHIKGRECQVSVFQPETLSKPLHFVASLVSHYDNFNEFGMINRHHGDPITQLFTYRNDPATSTISDNWNTPCKVVLSNITFIEESKELTDLKNGIEGKVMGFYIPRRCKSLVDMGEDGTVIGAHWFKNDKENIIRYYEKVDTEKSQE